MIQICILWIENINFACIQCACDIVTYINMYFFFQSAWDSQKSGFHLDKWKNGIDWWFQRKEDEITFLYWKPLKMYLFWNVKKKLTNWKVTVNFLPWKNLGTVQISYSTISRMKNFLFAVRFGLCTTPFHQIAKKKPRGKYLTTKFLLVFSVVSKYFVTAFQFCFQNSI